MAGLRKDVDRIIRQLVALGCTVTVTGGGHWRVHRKGCRSVTMAKSPSDQRSLHVIRQDVRMYFGIKL